MGLGALAGRVKEKLLLPYAVREGFARLEQQLQMLERRVRYMQEALGRIEARQNASLAPASLDASEFRVYSQWGEDGIIEHLVRHVPIARPVFVEFGVEGYEEANTRFLLMHRNWSGLVLDGDAAAVQRIRRSREYWLYDLTAVDAFITRDNINALLADHGVEGEIGLLSVDIDGMDYWIWEAIEVVRPAIVVVEYNARLGSTDAVTVPYDASFDRRKAHHSILYYGASLPALHALGERKGYDLVGCGSAGLNAFFVRKDLRPASIPARTPDEAYVVSRFCEAHDEAGRRIKLSHEEQMRLVRALPLVTVDGGAATARTDA